MEQRQDLAIPLWYQILPSFVLILFTSIIYYPSLQYEFQFDDIANITKHFNIRYYALTDLFFSGTRWISYWLNSLHYKIGKFDPFSYRVGNVIIHTANGLLIFFILLLILTKLPKKSFFTRHAIFLAFLTSLLFLLHPVQTQTVSYVIQGQLEGLSALFTLAMTLSFLLINTVKNNYLAAILTILFFILAIFSTGTKEIAIVTPALILLVDWFFVACGSWASLKNRFVFHLLTITTIFGIYVYLLKPQFFIDLFGLKMKVGNNLGNVITSHYDQMITPFYYFISQFKVILHYIWIFIWPLHISVEYDWVLAQSFFSPDCFFPFLILFFIGFILYKLLRQNPTNIIGFASLWFIINITPRSSIIPSPELLVDYKTYLASLGLLFIIATALIKSFDQLKRYSPWFKSIAENYYFPYLLTGCMALLLGIATMQRNLVWRSGLDFWKNIVYNAPNKARAYNNYGVELSQKLGKFAESIPFFKHAIEKDRHYRDPYNNLAVAYAATHQLDLAIETLQLSLRINPYYPEAYNNIASFMIEKKDYEQAKKALALALQLRPYYGKAHFNLGRVYMEEGESEKAREEFRKACMEGDLDTEAGFLGYAQCCLFLKKYDEAIKALKKALECNPNNNDAAFNLANAYFMLNDFNTAIAAYKTLLQKNPHDPRIWYNLAESHFSAGHTKEALECFEQLRNSPAITPNLFIRIAACYEKLGNPQRAKATLEELLRKNLPMDAKKSVTIALHKLIQQYHLA